MASVRRLKKEDPNSPWVVEYTDQGGKRRRQTPTSGLKKDAEKLRQKIERELGDGEHVADGETRTIARICEEYFRHLEDRYRAGAIRRTTLDSERSAANACIVPLLGAERLSQLTSTKVLRFYEDMIKVRGLRPVSARSRIRILALIEVFGKSKGYTGRLVVKGSLRELPRANRTTPKDFTAPQVEFLLAELASAKQKGDKRHYRKMAQDEVIVNIAAYCGMRLGEILALTRENLDFDKRRIMVRHSINRWGQVGPPKTSQGVRDVPMPERVGALITEYLERWYVENDPGLIFTTLAGGAVRGPNFWKSSWLPLLTRVGLLSDDLHHFHSLRSFTISWMIENGIPPTTVSKLVGHSNVAFTLSVYTRSVRHLDAYQADFDRVAGLLDAPLNVANATKTRQATLSH